MRVQERPRFVRRRCYSRGWLAGAAARTIDGMLSTRLELDRAHVELGRRSILRDVSLNLGPGDLQILIGPNGAGKTTLLRAALGIAPVRSGEVHLDGRPVGSWSGRERAARVGWLPQQEGVQEEVRVLDLVCAARFRFSEARSHSERRAYAALSRVDAAGFADRRFLQLSGGEQRRVAFAALLAQEAPLLLLDEPANHLDPAQQIEIYRLIGRLRQEGYGILCITHDLNLINHAIHRSEPSTRADESRGRSTGSSVPDDSSPGRKIHQNSSLDDSMPEQTPHGNSIRVLGLREGMLRFAVDFHDPSLREHLEDLYRVAVRVIDQDGTRHFLITRPLEEAPA